MKKLRAHRWILLTVLVLGMGVGFYVYQNTKENDSAMEVYTVVARDVRRVVTVTGRVEPAEEATLSFAGSGRIQSLNVDVGQEVRRGQHLASLSTSVLEAELHAAQSALDRERVLLSQLKTGVRPEEVAVTVAQKDSNVLQVHNSRDALLMEISKALTSADVALYTRADRLFTHPQTNAHFGITFTIANQVYSINASQTVTSSINRLRSQADENLKKAKGMMSNPQDTDVNEKALVAETALENVHELLDAIAGVLNSYTAFDSVAQSVYGPYQQDISTARNSISASLSSLRLAGQAHATAKAALVSSERQLELKVAPPTSESVMLQELRVREGVARVSGIQSRISENRIQSPFAGVVTRVHSSVGETVGAGTPVIALVSDANFHIRASVAESDITHVALGNNSEVTLDAFGSNQMFQAEIIHIDPVEIRNEAVSSYSVKLHFTEENPTIRSGMTANVRIFGSRREGVLAIPSRAIIRNGTRNSVRVLRNGSIEEVDIEIGLRGSDGFVEVTRGLSLGDEVITFLQERR
jgi:HlyD family secretion protein